MFVKVIRPGTCTTIQDEGRYGYESQGIPICGALDQIAMRQANVLVGQPEETPVIECVGTGPTLQFHGTIAFALTGAPFHVFLNDEPVPLYQTVFAKNMDVLRITNTEIGNACYLTFSGMMNIKEVLGSYATDMRSKIGGYQGRCLQMNDMIEVFETNMDHILKGKHASFINDTVTLRTVEGIQSGMFTADEQETFYNQIYRVSETSDRMGIRMISDNKIIQRKTDILSDGNITGAIQVTNGQPILFLADHATTGGYAKIATVITADLPKAAQLRPNDTVQFQKVEHTEALAALVEQKKSHMEWKEQLQIIHCRHAAERIMGLYHECE